MHQRTSLKEVAHLIRLCDEFLVVATWISLIRTSILKQQIVGETVASHVRHR